MALGSTQPLNRNEYQESSWGGGGEGLPARKADNLTAICEPIVWKNAGSSTSQNSMGPHGIT
jgi:hypothetical protein